MKRLEFRLHMTANNAWNGRWSGQDGYHAIYATMADKKAIPLLLVGSYSYSWNDGWACRITVRELAKGERKHKSDGFCGYDWMVRNIRDHGSPYYLDRPKEDGEAVRRAVQALSSS